MTFPKFDPGSVLVAPALDFDIKSMRDGTIAGLASPFGGAPDRAGDIVQKGAYARTLADHKREGTMPAMLWSHKLEEPIGKWTSIREERDGLYVEGVANLGTRRGREAFEHIANGDAGGLSIGYLIPEGGRKYNGDGSFTLLEVELVEISVVTIPAARSARITSAKSLNSKSDLIDMLREDGLSKAAAARIAAGGWPALAGDDHTKATELAAVIERATANLRRS